MNIVIKVAHPAHVHKFKEVISKQKNNNNVFVVAVDKEMTIYLLKYYKIEYFLIGKNQKGILKKILSLIMQEIVLYFKLKNFKPDIFVSGGEPLLAHVSFMYNKPYIAFDDTEHAKLIIAAYKPFASSILTPSCFQKDFGRKHIRYEGYHELAYLHPNYFKPDSTVLKLLGVKKGEKYVIMRFVSWNASHDVGHSGLSMEMKHKAVKELSKQARVFISSEGELSDDLVKYQINIPPEKMHDALAFASLFVGEGATMASECACLGTPAIYVNSLELGYCTEEEHKYNLVYGYRNSEGVLEKAIDLLTTPNLKQEFQTRRQKMLSDKIDVTAFMVWFIENYPESVKIMKENPDYQYRFK